MPGRDLSTLSDEELERIIAEDTHPAAPDALPAAVAEDRGTNADTPTTTGHPVVDAMMGMGNHLAKSAASLGELVRDPRNPGLPGSPIPSGNDFRAIGDWIASNVFGLKGEGVDDSGTLPEQIANTRDAIAPGPQNPAQEVGDTMGTVFENALPLLATGGGSAGASALLRGRGFLPAARQALATGAKEAAISGGITATEEGDVNGRVGASAALSGIVPVAGRALTGIKSGASDLIASSLLTTAPEAVKRGGSAARGLKSSGVVAGGVESLYKKLEQAAMKSTEKTSRFIANHPLGKKASFDRDEIAQLILDATQDVRISDVLDKGTKKTTINKLLGLYKEFTTPNHMASASDLLSLRRRLGEATNWSKGEIKTAANITKDVRHSMYRKINEMLERDIPEIAEYNKADFDILSARDAAEELLGKKTGAHTEFLIRRGVPLVAGAALGSGAGYTAGGSRGAALGGLAGGAALGSPATATALVQLLKTREGTRAAEIFARLFGASPELLKQEEER